MPRSAKPPRTSWAPRPTKVPSTQVFVLLTDLASLVANGPRADSHSRALPVSCGKFLDGPHHPSPEMRKAKKNLAPTRLMEATKRTRRMATMKRAPVPAMLAATRRCRVYPASTPHRQRQSPSPLRLELPFSISQPIVLAHIHFIHGRMACFYFIFLFFPGGTRNVGVWKRESWPICLGGFRSKAFVWE